MRISSCTILQYLPPMQWKDKTKSFSTTCIQNKDDIEGWVTMFCLPKQKRRNQMMFLDDKTTIITWSWRMDGYQQKIFANTSSWKEDFQLEGWTREQNYYFQFLVHLDSKLHITCSMFQITSSIRYYYLSWCLMDYYQYCMLYLYLGDLCRHAVPVQSRRWYDGRRCPPQQISWVGLLTLVVGKSNSSCIL